MVPVFGNTGLHGARKIASKANTVTKTDIKKELEASARLLVNSLLQESPPWASGNSHIPLSSSRTADLLTGTREEPCHVLEF